MFENIPAELRALNQWVAAGANKVPINPRTGKPADPSNPASGGTFAEAVQCGMSHIGFILGVSDPFTVIDLDNPYERNLNGVKSEIVKGDKDYNQALIRAERHQVIYNTFQTYAEISQSGKGAHLVMKGTIPCGVRRDKVEIYSDNRYIIFTGKIMRQFPVVDCQKNLDLLFKEIGKMLTGQGELIEEEPLADDSKLWEMATRATNSEKFISLCEGNWKDSANYPSQSEADYALISMLGFYTRSNEQVRRMFRQTALGKRSKATKNDYYINRSLKRIRTMEAPLVDISKLKVCKPVAEEKDLSSEVQEPAKKSGYTFPPGLVGDLARYNYSTALRQVSEVALAGAIALVAGVAGRSYAISNSGLQQYIVSIAPTGRGKEGASNGIDLLIAEVAKTIPMVHNFIGPAAFSSGQALIRTLSEKSCFISVLGEFGITLQQICHKDASSPELMTKKVLLDLYSKSGPLKFLRSSAYSETEKNTKIVQAPNVTILGDSTSEKFFQGLDQSHISEGLIPRFTIIEYKGKRPAKNKNAFHPPDQSLVKAFSELVTISINTSVNRTCCPISTTPEAQIIFDKFDTFADDLINDPRGETETELWNRADLKALKLGGLVAVGCDPHSPVVTAEIAQWSVDFIRREITAVARRFQTGDVGSGEGKQESEIRRLFEHFQNLTESQKKAMRCPQDLLDSKVASFAFFATYARRLACFANDKRGPNRAITDCIESMIKREILEMIPLQQLQSQFQMKSPIYYPGPGW